jgi:hypothetical protein
MSLRDTISKLKQGDSFVVDCRSQANYVRTLAKESGRQLRQQKVGDSWEFFCIGAYQHATGAWLRRVRTKREWHIKNYAFKIKR